MTTLEIPESLYKRLQNLAIPLEDTHLTVLERIVSHYESQNLNTTQPTETPKISKSAADAEILEFGPDAPPDLRHTDVLSAKFAGRRASGWNRLVHEAHLEAMSRLASIEALRSVTKSNFMVGRATPSDAAKGYRHVPGMNISIQNVDAAHAWSNTLRLARQLRVAVEVEFEWKQKADSAHPGRRGKLRWMPK